MYYLEPVVVPEVKNIPGNHYRLPKDELAVRRGMPVFSSEGIEVGAVDEFMIDEEDGQVTHLIMREGHLWNQQEITIPVDAIDRIKESKVRLKLKKDQIGALPAIPARRIWI
jgi:sporulation protein YlmC with PRC-barrel domain